MQYLTVKSTITIIAIAIVCNVIVELPLYKDFIALLSSL